MTSGNTGSLCCRQENISSVFPKCHSRDGGPIPGSSLVRWIQMKPDRSICAPEKRSEALASHLFPREAEELQAASRVLLETAHRCCCPLETEMYKLKRSRTPTLALLSSPVFFRELTRSWREPLI